MIITRISLDARKNGKTAVIDPNEAFRKLSLRDMLDQIEQTHHKNEKAQMKDISSRLKERDSNAFTVLQKSFDKLADALKLHFDKEEQVAFPMMWVSTAYDSETMKLMEELQKEHRDQEKLLEGVQEDMSFLNEDPSYQELAELFQTFFADVAEHISKEDEIVFTKYEEQVL